ncbi:hypothetical protein ATCC90586_002574 [Pythium insidiosum]|nr:hypothetical protein ATCC90586_002574 [Pythium insidiosum]
MASSDLEHALSALALGGGDDDNETLLQDAVRRSVLSGDAALLLTTLATHGAAEDQAAPLVFLMNWFHAWQQEYEAFEQVLEAEEAENEAGISDDDGIKLSSIEKDLEELEAEAAEMLRGFNTVAVALLEKTGVERPDALVDRHGWTLLMQAANTGMRGLLDELLARKADANCTGATRDGVNPLYLAVSSDHTSEAMALLKNGAIASATKVVRTRKETPVAEADDADDADAEMDEDCAWLQACRLGQLSVIEEMIALGVDVNFALPASGDRALHAAVMFEMQDVVEILAAHDAIELNAKNRSGQTCLFGCSNKELVEFLVSRGVDPQTKDADGETAYSIAHELGDEDVATFLKPLTAV